LYEPKPSFTSILYPVIAEPPLFEGADQERFICVGDAGVAVRLVGAPGTVCDEDDVSVADASADADPVPSELIADIL
jgi:hypothetical protein